MAAPTNVRVESNSVASARLDWSYAGANAISVWRAPHGGSYSDVTGGLMIQVGTTTFIDSTVVAGVFYDYKLSDDGGATFSAVVSVVIQSCLPAKGTTQSTTSPGLPQFVSEEDVNASNLQQMSQQVEATLTQKVLSPSTCTACPTNGAVVIDCSDGCTDFQVIASDDINSVSIVGCNNSQPGKIDFIIPPNVTRKICGFPAGLGFTGDECFNAPIVSGAAGRTVSVDRGVGAKAKNTSSQNGYGGMSGGGARGTGTGGTCFCTPTLPNRLTIKACNPNNSLGCQQANKFLDLIACGGQSPYSWSKTGSIILSRTTGPQITVTPPTNTGSAVAGTAYIDAVRNCLFPAGCTGSTCNTRNPPVTAQYDCNDVLVPGSCAIAWGGATCVPGNGTVSKCCPTAPCSDPSLSCPNFKDSDGERCQLDVRTAPMIAAGCLPCGVVAAGATVTVTDSIGSNVTIILKP